MMRFGSGVPEKEFGDWLAPWHNLSSMLSSDIEDSCHCSTIDRPCIDSTRAYRAMMVTLACALGLVQQAIKTEILKPGIDGYHP